MFSKVSLWSVRKLVSCSVSELSFVEQGIHPSHMLSLNKLICCNTDNKLQQLSPRWTLKDQHCQEEDLL